jgi:lipoate-protein ligase A
MTDEWRLIDSGPCSASYNMALDEAIAASVMKHETPATLRFYGWSSPSLSLGCFQKASDIDLAYCRSHHIPVVRRPTGGRAILHGDELTYSFSVRRDQAPFAGGLLESYRNISNAFRLAFGMVGIHVEAKRQREKGRVLTRSPLCFQSSSYGEILIENRKIVGSAQKRWQDGLLQQGSVPYAYDDEKMRHIFGMQASSHTKDGMTALKDNMPDFDEVKFKNAVTGAFEETFGISLLTSHPTEEEVHLARELELQKYHQDFWNFRL